LDPGSQTAGVIFRNLVSSHEFPGVYLSAGNESHLHLKKNGFFSGSVRVVCLRGDRRTLDGTRRVKVQSISRRESAAVDVQQKLLSHAHVSATVNVYGKAMMDSK
jgi:hypothetical protein